MTRIAIFCDGTWNSPTINETTNVHKLKRTLVSDPAKGQVAAYFPGIGTDERFDGPVRKFFNKWGGGAFGWGLDAKVKQAYQFLAQVSDQCAVCAEGCFAAQIGGQCGG